MMNMPGDVPRWHTFWDKRFVCPKGRGSHELREAQIRRKSMLAILRTASAGPDQRNAKRMVRRYLRSFTARLCAAASAYARKVKVLNHEATEEDYLAVFQMAGVLDAWKAPQQRARAYPSIKPNAAERWTISSGPYDYANQLLVKDVVEATGHFGRTQFAAKGGKTALDGWLAERLPTAALVMTVDIPKCFDTLRQSALVAGLLVPKTVMEMVVFRAKREAAYLMRAPEGYALMEEDSIVAVSSPNGGIPQGSACSSALAETVFKRIISAIEAVGPGVHAGCHADNFVVLVDDADMKQSVNNALIEVMRLNLMPAVIGELTDRIRWVDGGAPFLFAGRMRQRYAGGQKDWMPEAMVGNFGVRAQIDIGDARTSHDLDALQKLRGRVFGWVGSCWYDKRMREEAIECLGLIQEGEKHIEYFANKQSVNA